MMCRLSAKLKAAGTVNFKTDPLVEIEDFKCGASGNCKWTVCESEVFLLVLTLHVEEEEDEIILLEALVLVRMALGETVKSLEGRTEVIFESLKRTKR